jgi:hypothetical protein
MSRCFSPARTPGLTIPAVAVGLSSQSPGTKDATLYCAIVIGGLAMIALGAIRHCRDVM